MLRFDFNMLHKTALYYLNLINPTSAEEMPQSQFDFQNKMQASYLQQIALWIYIIVKID